MNKRESLAPSLSAVSESGMSSSPSHDDNIKIYLRIRPFTTADAYHGPAAAGGGGHSCIKVLDASSNTVQMSLPGSNLGHPTGLKPVTANSTIVSSSNHHEVFSYDSVGGPETTQEQVFHDVGRIVTDNCLQGYNGTIFA